MRFLGIVTFSLLISAFTSCNKSTQSEGGDIPIPTTKVALSSYDEIFAKAILEENSILEYLNQKDVRVTIIIPSDEAFNSYLKDNGYTMQSLKDSGELTKILKSNILLSEITDNGKYTSASGVIWNVFSNSTNIPQTINGLTVKNCIKTLANESSSYFSHICEIEGMIPSK